MRVSPGREAVERRLAKVGSSLRGAEVGDPEAQEAMGRARQGERPCAGLPPDSRFFQAHKLNPDAGKKAGAAAGTLGLGGPAPPETPRGQRATCKVKSNSTSERKGWGPRTPQLWGQPPCPPAACRPSHTCSLTPPPFLGSVGISVSLSASISLRPPGPPPALRACRLSPACPLRVPDSLAGLPECFYSRA